MQQIAQAQKLSLESPYLLGEQQALAPLPYPVYFVTKDPKWQDLINCSELPPVESLYERCIQGHDIWSAQAYIDLKRQGLNVHLVSKPVPGQICVIPLFYLYPKDWLFKSYVVGCRYDTAHPELCNQRIVINRLQVTDQTHHFLPHRPQPNLNPRNQSRGATIRNLVFKGHDYNLYAAFRTPAFIDELRSLGITLVTNTDQSKSQFSDWADYTEADVVLAVRNNTQFDINLKPALKLINAWLAGCPAILGPEPAYQELRQSALDYIEVRTPEETIAALKYLQDNPDVYLAMIENGFQRAREFTLDQILLQWRNLLAGPIATGYEQWCRQSWIEKQAIRPVRYFGQILKQRRADRHYKHHIHHGPRILSGTIL